MKAAAMLYAGFAETDITPKLGSESPGGMLPRVFNEVHDPLKAVAVVIKGEKSTVALVGIDAVFVSEQVTARARAAIEAATKIPAHHVLIGASHTHSGGPVADSFGSTPDPDYLTLIVDRVTDAVRTAFGSLHEAEIGTGFGHEPSISFNRRFLMRDGREVTHPGKTNREIVRPAGPIDPDVGVLAVRVPGGPLLGLFVNFACHLTVVNGSAFSADYVYYLRQTVRQFYKRPDLPVGFLLGSAGDITQVDNRRRGQEFGHDWAAMFGLALGAEVAHAVARMTWEKSADVAAVRTVIPIPIRDDHDEIGRKPPKAGLGSGTTAETVYAKEKELLAKERAEHPVVDCEVQAVRIGDLGIVTNGAEFFCQLGLDIKASSPFPKTWISSLTNQRIGYVGTASAFYAGGYETRTARSAKLAPGAGQALVEGSIAALRDLHRTGIAADTSRSRESKGDNK